MIALVIALFACAVLATYFDYRMTQELARSLRAMNAQLYADNQALMTALAQANGQQLRFEPVAETAKENPARKPTPPPYWKSKETADVQIGNKTITVTKH